MTDRERLLELAEAVMAGYSIWGPIIDRVSRQLCMRAVTLAEAVWIDDIVTSSRPAEEVFKELDQESQEWDNEGGQ